MNGVCAIVVRCMRVRHHGRGREGNKISHDLQNCFDELSGNYNENECRETETLHDPEQILG